MKTLVLVHEEPSQYEVKLEQTSHGLNPRFRVTYGAEKRDDLSYREAAHELGYFLMHQAGCAGRIDITMTSFVPGARTR